MKESATRLPCRGFNYVQFGFWVGAQLVVILAILFTLFPSVMRNELGHANAILLTTFFLNGVYSLFEFFYHRYFLHDALVSWLKAMYVSHTHHHKITPVKILIGQAVDGTAPVDNRYPIEHADQEEDMEFPRYAYSLFNGIFLIFPGLPLKLFFPALPIIISTIIGVFIAYVGYEVWHAILHLPAKKWSYVLYRSRFKKPAQRVYGFHWLHHFNIDCNMAVFGWWGVAVWDRLFGTKVKLPHVPPEGKGVNVKDIQKPKPKVWLLKTDRRVRKITLSQSPKKP